MDNSPANATAEHKRALVFGASGGIGRAVVEALAADPAYGVVYAAARSASVSGDKIVPLAFDLTDDATIQHAVSMAAADGPLDLVFVATGMLHDAAFQPEKSLRALTPDALEQAFRINTVGPALIAKHALPHLRRDRKAVFATLSARVGSISDNRLGGWHSYRASKAALNMLVRTMAIELARTHPKALCVTLHPGTVDTALSKPFQARVPDGKLFTAEQSANAMLAVLEGLGPDQSGGLFAWDGQSIPF